MAGAAPEMQKLSQALLNTVYALGDCMNLTGTFTIGVTTVFTTKSGTTFTIGAIGAAVTVGGPVAPASFVVGPRAGGAVPIANAVIKNVGAAAAAEYVGGVALVAGDTVTIYGADVANTVTFTVTKAEVPAAGGVAAEGQFTMTKAGVAAPLVFGGRKRSSKSRRQNHKSKITRSKKTRQTKR